MLGSKSLTIGVIGIAVAVGAGGNARAQMTAFSSTYTPGGRPADHAVRPLTRAEAYWTQRAYWEHQMSLRRNHPTPDDVMRYNAQRAPVASLTDFAKKGNVRWPARIWESPLAADAALFDTISEAQLSDEQAGAGQAVAVLDRMLVALKDDLPQWRPMEYSQTKSQLLRLRNWSLRGFE